MALMPLPDLYAVLVPLLSPAAYMAALRADPLLWRRAKISAFGLPSPAAMVHARLERLLRRQLGASIPPALCDDWMERLEAGTLCVVGNALLALLNGDPFDESRPLGMAYVYVSAYPEEEDEEWAAANGGLPRAPRKRKTALLTTLRGLGGDAAVIAQHDPSNRTDYVAGDLCVSFYGYQTLQDVAQAHYYNKADFPFCSNLYGGGKRLAVRDLCSVVLRSCEMCPDTDFAPCLLLQEHSEHLMTALRSDVMARIGAHRECGYEVRLVGPREGAPLAGDPNGAPLFTERHLNVTPLICKKYLEAYNPRTCRETIECTCYDSNPHGHPRPDCMSKHNCACAAHQEWRLRAERAWIADLRERFTKQWTALWASAATPQASAQPEATRDGVVKRLKFE